MIILDLQTGSHCEKITDAIDLGSSPVISVVGAGGKTTVVKQLAAEYGRAAITTTTHMYKECPLAVSADEVNRSDGVVWFGTDEGEKISSSPFIDEVHGIPLIIEADGSKHKPFKVPRDHEPAVYSRSTAVIGVLGIDALGKAISDVSHSPEWTARFLGEQTEHELTTDDFVKVIMSKSGLMKNVDCDFYVFINKVDTLDLLEQAIKISRKCKNIRMYAVTFYG